MFLIATFESVLPFLQDNWADLVIIAGIAALAFGLKLPQDGVAALGRIVFREAGKPKPKSSKAVRNAKRPPD
jgi:hypothetical protein